MKNIEIVNAYSLLKGLKLAEMSEDLMKVIWKNIKELRPAAEEYEKSKSERQKSLIDEKMQKPIEEFNALGNKVRNEGYKPTPLEEAKMRPVIDYLNRFNTQYATAINELNTQEVKMNLVKISDNELLKLLQKNGKGFEDMESLSCMSK